MPLHVDITVNRELLHRIHIGRETGGTHPDDINTYRALETAAPDPRVRPVDETINWDDPAHVTFTHRYGDGATACIARALHALNHALAPAGTMEGPDELGSAYLRVSDPGTPVHRTVTVTANIDYAADGTILGIELLDMPSHE